MASLHLLDGTDLIDFTVPGIYTLGRDPVCDFVIDHASVTGKHAEVEYQPNFLQITDQNSTNGIRVNYADVLCQTLMDGDILEIGSVSYNVRGPELRPKNSRKEGIFPKETSVSSSLKLKVSHPTSDFDSQEVFESLELDRRPLVLFIERWKGSVVSLFLLLLGGLLVYFRLGSVGVGF